MSEEQNNGRANRGWIGAAFIVVVMLGAIRGLSRAPGFLAWALGHWYWSAGIILLAVAGSAAVYRLVSRAYRR